MDVAQDLIYNTSRYIHSKLLITIFKLMMPIENSILLKSHVSCNFMLKYYISFWTYIEQTKIWKFICLFDLCN